MNRACILTKVTEFDTSVCTGGMPKAIRFNYQMMSNIFDEVHVVTPTLGDNDENIIKGNIHFHSCKSPALKYCGEFSTRSSEWCNALRPDVIIVHSGAGNGVLKGTIPKIYVEHGFSYQSIQTKIIENYLIRKDDGFKDVLFNSTERSWVNERKYIMSFDRCVFLTELTAMEMREKFLVPQSMYLPLSIEEVEVADNVQKEYDVVFCSNAMKCSNKGFSYLCNIAKKNPSLKILVIGGDAGTTIHGCGNMRFTGKLQSPKKVYESMRSGKILVELSYHQTGCNMVKIEALYSGLPIIGWNVTSSYATIREGINGHIVPLLDMDELEKKIYACLDDHVRMGMESRMIYDANFSNNVYMNGWKRMLESL